MRYLIILILFFFASNVAWGQFAFKPGNQYEKCGTLIPLEYTEYMNRTKLKRDKFRLPKNFRIPTIQLAVHIISENRFVQATDFPSCAENDTTCDSPSVTNLCNLNQITADINEAIIDLNNIYEQVGMQFEIGAPINAVDDSEYVHDIYPCFFNDPDSQILPPETNEVVNMESIPGMINIFYAPNIGLGLAGSASLPSPGKGYVFIKNSAADEGAVLAHEIGHYFNLLHTFAGANDGGGRVNEMVNDSNCGKILVGDELCDTPADPEGLNTTIADTILLDDSFFLSGCVSSFPECKFEKSDSECIELDENEDQYMPDPKNIMSYTTWSCMTYFSPQQIERMIVSLIVDRPELLNNSGACPVSKSWDNDYVHNFGTNEINEVSWKIYSEATVKGENMPDSGDGANVEYSAGGCVLLYPSFEAEYTSTFLAHIEGCEPLEESLKALNTIHSNLTFKSLNVFPNPFSNYAEIDFHLLKDSQLTIEIFDVVGKQISTLVSSKQYQAGKHSIPINGSKFPSGIYYCTIQAGDQIETQKMVLTK